MVQLSSVRRVPSLIFAISGFLVSQSISIDVFATVVDGDKRVLEITSFNELETSDDNNIVLNIFAIQLGVPSGIYASDPEAAGSGSSDSTGGEDSTPGDNTIITEFEDGTGCIDCDVDGNVLDIP